MRSLSSRFALPFLLIALPGLLALAPSGTPAGDDDPLPDDALTVDAMHSTLLYRVRHFGVSYFHGRVNKPTGSFLIDDENLGDSYLRVSAEIKNMDAGDEGRDRFLMSPDFFNAREYPASEFKSSAVRKTADGTYEADGVFTMHGVDQPVMVVLSEYTAKQTDRFGFRAGFECTFTVKRSDFGMDLFVKEGTLGDEVRITAAIEGVRLPKEE